VILAACSREQAPTKGAATERAIGGTPLASKPFFRIDAVPQPSCASGGTCEARLRLTALGDYHVNPQYPFKFEGDPTPGIELDGTGTLAQDDAKTATMTIRFRPAKAGKARLTGTFKLSVCTDDNCEIETPKIAFDVTAS